LMNTAVTATPTEALANAAKFEAERALQAGMHNAQFGATL